MNYPSPCGGCKRSEPTGCAKSCQKYHICYRRLCCYSHNENPEKFRYEHPDVYRRYIMTNPCEKCKAKENCQTVCATYWRWWDDRMEWFRRRLGL